MNKSEHRHQLIRALVTKNKIHTQAELQALLADNDIQVTQATLSRDIKSMNLSKVREEDNSYYVLNAGSTSVLMKLKIKAGLLHQANTLGLLTMI